MQLKNFKSMPEVESAEVGGVGSGDGMRDGAKWYSK